MRHKGKIFTNLINLLLQNADPLTALMYAVQVMNFLKTLIVRTLREREDSVVETSPQTQLEPSDEDGNQSSSQPCNKEAKEETDVGNEGEKAFVTEEPASESSSWHSTQDESTITGDPSFLSSIENIFPGGNRSFADNCPCEVTSQVSSPKRQSGETRKNTLKSKTGQSSSPSHKKGSKKVNEQILVQSIRSAERSKKAGILGSINSRKELVEAWR